MGKMAVLFIVFAVVSFSLVARADVKVVAVGDSISDAEKQEIEKQKKVLDEILRLYAEESLDRPKNLAECVREMFAMRHSGKCRDKFTHYYAPKDAAHKSDEMRGVFGGVGLEITDKEGSVVVIAPIAETPAEKAGIESGDIIVKVNGKEPKSADDAAKMLRGKPGTKVTITIFRERGRKEIEFLVIRKTITVKNVKWRISLADKETGIIEIRGFDANLMTQFSDAIIALVKKGTKNIVIDLRNNPGGLLNSSLALLALFSHSRDTLLTVRTRNNRDVMTSSRMPFRALMDFMRASIRLKEAIKMSHLRNIGTAVLVNNGSASASEIFSGTMKDWGYPIIGEKTFGKGVGQTVLTLNDGSMLSITTFEFLVGNRAVAIRDKGVVPIIHVKAPERKPGAKYDEKNDRQLNKAIEVLKDCAKNGPLQGYRCTR